MRRSARAAAVVAVVLADADGVVRWSALGVPSAHEFGEALEDLGVVPPPDGTAIPFG